MSLSVSTLFLHSISSPKDSILGMNYVMPGLNWSPAGGGWP